jgi:hypothetical protein
LLSARRGELRAQLFANSSSFAFSQRRIGAEMKKTRSIPSGSIEFFRVASFGSGSEEETGEAA